MYFDGKIFCKVLKYKVENAHFLPEGEWNGEKIITRQTAINIKRILKYFKRTNVGRKLFSVSFIY